MAYMSHLNLENLRFKSNFIGKHQLNPCLKQPKRPAFRQFFSSSDLGTALPSVRHLEGISRQGASIDLLAGSNFSSYLRVS